jgi:hypothetical protein
MQKLAVASFTAIMLGALFLAKLAQAEPGDAPSHALDSLRDLTGIYAHSSADCAAQLGGQLDGMDTATSADYEVIGLCDDGIDPLHQPVECGASHISRMGSATKFTTKCYVKDYPAEDGSAAISDIGNNRFSISLDSDNVALGGEYLRCSKNYSCQHFRRK